MRNKFKNLYNKLTITIQLLVAVALILTYSQLLSLTQVSAAAPAFVQSNTHVVYSGTANTTSFTSNVSANDLIVVSFRANQTVSSVTSTCVTGNLTTAVSLSDGGTYTYYVDYGIANASGSCSVSINVASSGVIYAIIQEVSGIATSNPVDVTSAKGNNFTTAVPSSGTVTTTQSGDYILGYGGNNNGVAISSAGTGFTQRADDTQHDYTEDQVQSSAGSIAATFNMASSSGNFIVELVAFQPASTVPNTTPPVISAITSSSITQSAATITWTTDENSDSQVDYGTTTSYGSSSALNSSLTTTHTITLSSLSPSTLYHYRVKSSDASGNLAVSADNTFTTTATPPADTTAPTVPTGLTATAISSSGINLSWTAATDVDNTSAQISYTIYRGGVQIATTATGVTSYSDTGLTASTSYSYSVLASDPSGNTSAQSTSAAATTQSAPQPGTYPWSGIIAPSRATDWSQAGIPGGLPDANWTQCGSTIAAYGSAATPASPATINSAISSCGTNQYVLLGTGDFYLNGGIDFAHKNNVVLRGQGANNTRLHFSAVAGCNGWGAAICLAGSNTYEGGGYNTANWTANYSQGTTQITLDSVTGIVPNLTPIVLDQCDTGFTGSAVPNANCTGSATDNNGWFVCDVGGICVNQTAAGGYYRKDRAQTEVVVATAISGTGPYTVTISPGIRSSNWSAGQSPQAWWGPQTITNSGVENLTVDAGTVGARSVTMMMANKTWVSGITSVKANNQHILSYLASHTEVQNSYFYWTYNAAQQSYGLGCTVSDDVLFQNNIFQGVTDPISMDGGCAGGVSGYNFAVNNYNGTTAYLWPIFQNHSAGTAFYLSEGNVASQALEDDIHGTHQADTFFRNYYNGFEPNNGVQTSANTAALGLSAFSRYMNVVGNVLGSTARQNAYQYAAQTTTDSACTGGQGSNCREVYDLGYSGNTLGTHGVSPNDPKVWQTLFRWGNYDVITNGVRWCGTGAEVNCGGTSEVPTTDAYYPNPVPASQSLPASFYLSAKPSWVPASASWPLVGPDVSAGGIFMCTSGTYVNSLVLSSAQCAGGTSVAVMAGHAEPNPAMQCYLNTMNGTPDGTGAMLSFNADLCYASAGVTPPPTDTTPPTTPTGLTAQVVSTSQINLSWSASTDVDNTASQLTYKVFRNGTLVNTTAAGVTSYSDTGLSAGTTYSYTVSAFDAAGNTSAQSTSVPATTQSSPDTTAPTVSITSPSAGTVSGTVTVSATASDPTVSGQTTSGLSLVTISIDGAVSATTTSGSLSKSLDTTTLTNASHTITAVAKDNAGNQSTTASVSITVNNASATKYPRLVTLTALEGLSAIPSNTTITATVLSGATVLETQSNLTASAGNYTVSFLSSDPQLVNIRIKVNGYLSQLITSVDTTVNSSVALSVPQLLAGDSNNDNIINSLDYSLLNSNYNQTFALADFNGDGLVNSLDYAILKNNYGKSGQ